MEETIFTKIINREIPATIRYEDDQFIAFDDISKNAPVHVLVVTKEPYQSLEDIPEEKVEIYAGLLLTVRKVARIMGIEKNYRLVVNVGSTMQLVRHVHIHIMGGWSDKKLEIVRQKNI